MAESYEQQQSLRLAQADLRSLQSQSGRIVRAGKIIGPGSKASTDSASFWNVQTLTSEFATINLNVNNRFTSLKEVRPCVRNVASPLGAVHVTDEVVFVVMGPQRFPNKQFEETELAFDLLMIDCPESIIIQSGSAGSGSCGMAHYQGLNDKGFAGIME